MKLIKTFVLAVVLAFSQTVAADPYPIDGYDVVFDAAVVRPMSFIGMIAGSVAFTALLPFTAIANIPQPHEAIRKAAEVLVVGPAQYTFARPAGDFGFTDNSPAEVHTYPFE